MAEGNVMTAENDLSELIDRLRAAYRGSECTDCAHGQTLPWEHQHWTEVDYRLFYRAWGPMQPDTSGLATLRSARQAALDPDDSPIDPKLRTYLLAHPELPDVDAAIELFDDVTADLTAGLPPARKDSAA